MSGIVYLLILVPGVLFAYAILRPLSKKLARHKGRTQFFLSDLFSLLLLLQLPLGYAAVTLSYHETTFVAVVGGLLSLVVLWVWWRGVGILSRLGIDAPFRRLVFIVIILPAAILGSLASMVLIALALQGLPPPIVWMAVIMVPLLCYGFRRLTFWVLSGATKEQEPPSGRDLAPPRHKRDRD